MGRPRNTIYDVLLKLVIEEPSTLDTGCWTWPGGKSSGYGMTSVNGKMGHVHKFVYEHFVGPVPEDKHLHHRCEHPSCANFEHLELLTPKEHIYKHNGLGALNALKTHCKYGHSLSDKNLYLSPSGHRICRQCMRRWWKEAYEREREKKLALPKPLRKARQRKIVCTYGHSLVEDRDVYLNPKGVRECRECIKRRKRECYKRKQANKLKKQRGEPQE